MATIIDPPEGWRHGFPRRLTRREGQTLEEWLEEAGYPKVLIDQGMANHCRYWEEEG